MSTDGTPDAQPPAGGASCCWRRGGKVLKRSIAAGKTQEELLAAIQKAVKQLFKKG